MIYVAANTLRDTVDIHLTHEICTGKKIHSVSLGRDHELLTFGMLVCLRLMLVATWSRSKTRYYVKKTHSEQLPTL